jgi:hypothetical protein
MARTRSSPAANHDGNTLGTLSTDVPPLPEPEIDDPRRMALPAVSGNTPINEPIVT